MWKSTTLIKIPPVKIIIRLELESVWHDINCESFILRPASQFLFLFFLRSFRSFFTLTLSQSTKEACMEVLKFVAKNVKGMNFWEIYFADYEKKREKTHKSPQAGKNPQIRVINKSINSLFQESLAEGLVPWLIEIQTALKPF